MFTTTQESIVSDPAMPLRVCARVGAAALFVTWFAFVLNEAVRSDMESLATHAYPLAAALAVVFAGYAIGVWNELIGGALTLLGMVAFYIVHVVTLSIPPDPAMAAFALPGVFYILAWNGHRADVNSRASDL